MSKERFDCCGQSSSLMRVDEAVALLRARITPVTPVESVALDHAQGRILAEDLTSGLFLPPFDNSAVDGWAVRCADLDGKSSLPIGGRIAAGHPLAEPVRPGYAYRIFTGAPVPEGLDAVLMQEDCRAEGKTVQLPAAKPGQNIRSKGEGLSPGQIALKAGTVLGPQHLGVAAMLGQAVLPLRRRLRVALFSTGDELREPGSHLEPGCQYDANRFTLKGMLQGLGCAVSDLGILPDRLEPLTQALRQAATGHDLIVTSGGVSVGDEDHVKTAVQAAGALHFWRLALKPGKPLALGEVDGTAFLGLPGNPVSVMVTFLLIGRPLVAALSGGALGEPRRWPVQAAFAMKKKPGRREFPRARLLDGPVAELFRSDSSGMLVSMTEADGLLDLPENSGDIAPGDTVSFLPFRELLS